MREKNPVIPPNAEEEPPLFDMEELRIHPVNEPQPDRMLQFFAYAHLPPQLQAVSELFCDLAYAVVARCPQNPERTVALRKLLEAKDAAVRTLLYKG